MTDVTNSPTSNEFSVLALITFLLKIDIFELTMLNQLYGDEGQVKLFKYCSWSVLDFAYHVRILS